MKAPTILLLLMALLLEAHAWRIFHRGRMVGGNLGLPRPERKRTHTRSVSEKWFAQNLDHFNPTDERIWQQRYYSNDQFFDSEKGGPVFLMVGGEGEATIDWMTEGAWVTYGATFGALLFQLEHRFYGKSHPTEDMSTENLALLTSQQALADLATFINAMNEKYKLPKDVKWIAFGGSYPGSLAAWLRYKYPHLVHGAMSASGPLLAKVDFLEYFEIVKDSLATHSDECVTSIQQGFTQVGNLLKKKLGQQNLNKIFKLCDPIEDSLDNRYDISNFYESIANNFAGVVQYNGDNRHSKSNNNISINNVCDIMVDQDVGPPVNRLGKVNELILNSEDQPCLDFKYDKMIEVLKNTSWESEAEEGARQWMYQTCTEFGFYQTSTGQPHIFGDQFPVDLYIQECRDLFGGLYTDQFIEDAVERTNTLYGALDLEVSNVVFVHGSIDPWHALGITKTIEAQAPAIYIQGTAHCANMYTPIDTDPPKLKAARQQIAQLIDTWLRL